MAKELYSRLGLDENATESEIRSAYERLSSACSSGNGLTDAGSTERYRLLTEAYEVLSDMDRRAAYDICGKDRKQRNRKRTAGNGPSSMVRARSILNTVFLCGAVISTVLFVTYLSGSNPMPFYIACGISLVIKIAEYIIRLIQ
ncbi:MAG: J domain-containing protein [Bacteroidaceae bacterium]|nr:J domain-containing protein [Bacteroidaceae bacterium]